MARAKDDARRLPVVGLAIFLDLVIGLFTIQNGHDNIQHDDEGMVSNELRNSHGPIGRLLAFDRRKGRMDDGLVKFSVLLFVVDNQKTPGIAGHGTPAFRGNCSFAFCHFPSPQKGIFDYLHRPISTLDTGSRKTNTVDVS